MKLWMKHLCALWFVTDKCKSTPIARLVLRLEELERRETCNSLYNPLFGTVFSSLNQMDVPYSIVQTDDSTPSGTSSSTQGSAAGGTPSGEDDLNQGAPPGATQQTSSDNFSAADSAFASATSAIDLNASLFDSVLSGDDASFAAKVAADIGGSGAGTGGSGGVGAAVVIGLPTLAASGATTSGGSQSGDANPPPVTPGSPPAVSPAPGTAPTVGVGLSSSQFGLGPFTLLGGATVSALTPFVVSSGVTVPAAASGGGTVANGGTDANDIGYTTTTTDSYSFGASLAQDSNGGLSYQETYSFSYDVQTVAAVAGGASVHDWGASGYTFIANNDNGNYTFTLVAALTTNEIGSQTQTITASDGTTSTSSTTWQSCEQYDQIIHDTTAQATGVASGDESGAGVGTGSSTTTGTYSQPISVGSGSGTVSGAQSSYSGEGESYQFSINETQDASGVVTQTGTWNEGNGGYAGDSYSGSGSYSVASASGGGSTAPSISSVPDATAVPSASGGPNATGATMTGGGTYQESGADSSGYGYSDQYALQSDGSWLALSGAGSSSSNSFAQSNYSGSGSYGYAIAGGAVSGTWQENGNDSTNNNALTNSTLGDGWTTAETYGSGDGGAQSFSYQGSGAYAVNSVLSSGYSSTSSGSSSGTEYSGSGSGDSGNASGSDSGSGTGLGYTNVVSNSPTAAAASPIPSASGGLSAPGASFSGAGTVTESGSIYSSYGDASVAAMGADGTWQQTSWNASAGDGGNTHWSYLASGGYAYAIAGGNVAGLWQQSGNAGVDFASFAQSALGDDGSVTNTGSQNSDQQDGKHSSYTGSGNYGVASGVSDLTVGVVTGSGLVTESGADDYTDAYAIVSPMGSDGTWQPATGSGNSTQTDSSNWSYVASGGYSRPLDGGTLQGTWQASGGAGTNDNAPTTSTLNPDGSWTTTGTALSGGSGSGSWSYSGSGSFSSSSSYGDSDNGGDSTFNSNANDNYSQGWSSQYNVVSTLAADGSVSTVTTAGASGSTSGTHGYTSSGTSDSWSQTGDYAAGNGSASGSQASSNASVRELLQSNWQEGYTITSLPGQVATITGGTSGSSHAIGDASSQSSGSIWSESDSSGSGYSYASGQGEKWYYTTGDHYDDQSSWSQPYNSTSMSGSGAVTVNHVWGSSASGSTISTWWNSQGSGSGMSGGSYSAFSSSGGYDQDVAYTGFSGAQYGPSPLFDGYWKWGEGWGGGTNGPLGLSAYGGVGYTFAPGGNVPFTDPGGQLAEECSNLVEVAAAGPMNNAAADNTVTIDVTGGKVQATTAGGTGLTLSYTSSNGLPALVPTKNIDISGFKVKQWMQLKVFATYQYPGVDENGNPCVDISTQMLPENVMLETPPGPGQASHGHIHKTVGVKPNLQPDNGRTKDEFWVGPYQLKPGSDDTVQYSDTPETPAGLYNNALNAVLANGNFGATKMIGGQPATLVGIKVVEQFVTIAYVDKSPVATASWTVTSAGPAQKDAAGTPTSALIGLYRGAKYESDPNSVILFKNKDPDEN